MKASYVLPCYIPDEDIMTLTRAAIQSFRKVKAELVIADDASPVGGGYLRKEADIYIRTSENEGYYSTITRAIKLAKGEIVALCNNDIRVAPNWLEVSEKILKDPEIASVHFKMLHYDQPMSFGDKVWTTGKERWCTTSFCAVKKEVYEKLGFYDPFYKRGGFGDWDFWIRVREAGYKQAYTNKSCYQHRDSAVTSRMHGENWWESEEENIGYFKQKWGKTPDEFIKDEFPAQLEVDYRGGFE